MELDVLQLMMSSSIKSRLPDREKLQLEGFELNRTVERKAVTRTTRHSVCCRYARRGRTTLRRLHDDRSRRGEHGEPSAWHHDEEGLTRIRQERPIQIYPPE